VIALGFDEAALPHIGLPRKTEAATIAVGCPEGAFDLGGVDAHERRKSLLIVKAPRLVRPPDSQ